jgi:hypothetical protein
MVRRLLMAAAVTVMVPMAATLAPSAANAANVAGAASAAHAASAAATAACTSGVAVSEFAFNPSTVPVTSQSPLTLVLQNCTTQTLQGSTVWYGQYAGQNCPVIDPPPPFPYTIAPGGSYTLTNTYGSAGGSCQPTSLKISANINVNGVTGTVTTVSATLQFSACTNGIAINQLSFNPATVPVGQTSTLTLVLQDCGSQPVQGFTTWMSAFTWAGGTGLPPGCPVSDPVAFSYSLAPGGTTTETLGLGDPIASCEATGIKATVNVSVNGVTGTAATATANLVITGAATGGCHVTYTPSNWQGGFTANVTIADNGSSAISGWTLTFAFPGDQKITNAWNASVTQSGTGVTATNLSYNAVIPAGGSQSFGFQGTWTASDASPTSFTVNGIACT